MPPADFSPLTRRAALRRLGLIGGATVASALAPSFARAATPVAMPTLLGAQPGFYRFRIGDFEALAVNDGELALPLAQSPFGLGQPPEKVQEVLAAAYLPKDQVRLAINVLLVRTKSDLVLVDAGCGALFGPVGGRVVNHLAAAGIKPEQVTAVVLTHLHGDHFGGLFTGPDRQPVYPNARYVIARKEHDFWSQNPSLATSRMPEDARAQTVQGAQAVLQAFKGKWERVSSGDRVFEGVEFVDAPGHTAGHIGVAFTSGQDQLINIADLVHHHAISFRHPEWLLAFDVDPERAATTRRQLLDRLASDRSRVFGVHLPFPGLGRVRAEAGAYDYVIEPWQPLPAT